MNKLRVLFSVTPEIRELRRGVPEKPAVLLFGWSGGRMAHLAKYAQLWDAESRVMALAAPLGIFRGPKEKDIAAVAREMVQATTGPTQPVYLHIFSNGGLVYASRAFDILGDRVIGTVFDSSPSLDLSYKVPATVVAEALNIKALKGVIWWITYVFLTVISSIFGRPDLVGFFGFDRFVNLHGKKLFLYSSADIITNAEMLRGFIAKTPNSESHDFIDAPHVALFPKYPKVYAEKIQRFRELN